MAFPARKIRYIAVHLSQHALQWPLYLVKLGILKTSISTYHAGIAISDVHLSNTEDPQKIELFVQVTKDALDFLAEHDPRRFRRVQREIKYIVNQPLLSEGQYSCCTRECKIDFRWEITCRDEGFYEWNIARYASLLVHEATHGHLFSRYIPYTHETHLRVEKICVEEAKRFARHIRSERYTYAADLVEDFDPTNWNQAFGSPFRRSAAYMKMVRQLMKKQKRPPEK